MSKLASEIQEISDNADKCVNYPIGDKLAAFMRQQEADDATNFVLSGVLIYAAAKVFGRKVDYLEQEILGIAKNFEQISAEEETKTAKEVKKSRTKKFTIKDAINIDKVTFEEKEIQVVTKNDINKTLATPSRITRLQKMKDFFAKNKSKTGKLPIPKSLLMNDAIVSNFGDSLIHDYDDYKDIVGSRKDFRSHSYFVNHHTGELKSEVNFNTRVAQQNDFIVSDPQIITSEETTLKDIEIMPTLPTPPPSPTFDFSGKMTPVDDLNINLDEGIGMDEDLLHQPPENMRHFPEIQIETYEPVKESEPNIASTITQSIDSIRDLLESSITDFQLPIEMRMEVKETRMKNILMIPLKRLKHKCIFDLPDSEFRELKRRKLDQWKPTVLVPEVINPRIFKCTTINESTNADDVPFLGFTKEEQNEPLTKFNFKSRPSKSFIDKSLENDSGFDSFEGSSSEEIDMSDTIDSHEISTSLQETSLPEINISGADSCYQSMNSGVSGDSSKSLLPSFSEEFNIGHSTEIDILQEEQSSLESEERVKQMQQSAMNVAKWKEFLKPRLAESEKRSKIDMHAFGLNVINKIGTVNQSKKFNEIVDEGQTPAYFLTMLQLINNRNIEVKFTNKTITAPTELHDISLTLKSKVVHKEKFDEMGEQFNQAEENKKLTAVLKRKAVQTSTPAKRRSQMPSEISLSFDTPNTSAVDDSQQMCRMLSQASSGYFSQNSTFSDF